MASGNQTWQWKIPYEWRFLKEHHWEMVQFSSTPCLIPGGQWDFISITYIDKPHQHIQWPDWGKQIILYSLSLPFVYPQIFPLTKPTGPWGSPRSYISPRMAKWLVEAAGVAGRCWALGQGDFPHENPRYESTVNMAVDQNLWYHIWVDEQWWTSTYHLFWCSLGTTVLTHGHI